MQASWSGSIVFGLVSVPIQLYKAAEEHAGPVFHQVHIPDGGRIRLKRYCEAEGVEVPLYQVARAVTLPGGRQIVLTSGDLEHLPIPSKNIIDVQAFVDADTFDPIQYGAAYYVGLGNRSPAKPYALLREAMRDRGQVAVAKVTMTTRESLAMLRVVDDLLVLQTMLWPDEVRSARGIAPPDEKLHANELKMLKSLMHEMTKGFDVSALRDEYRQALEDLVDAKLHGAHPAELKRPAAAPVVDIAQVLAESLAAERARHEPTATGTSRRRGQTKKATNPAAKKASSRRRTG